MLQKGHGHVDFAAVIRDMRSACDLRPDDLLLSVNLIQALLDNRQVEEALELARRTQAMHPATYPANEKLALAAVASHQWREALVALQKAQSCLRKGQTLPASLAGLLKDLSVQWWEPIVKPGFVMRIPEMADQEFLSSTFQNQQFMQHYHRFQGGGEDDVRKIIAAAKLSPRQTRRMDWIVLDRHHHPVGLAAIVDIDWGNQRGEWLIGFPNKQSQTLAFKTSVAVLEFAFRRFALAKVLIYVYEDNPDAQTNALHLGFQQEGRLRSHIATSAGRIDLYINGMTLADFEKNPLLGKLEKRWATPC
jgi:RimJ/RimL family protein N-acetyltransferase